MSLRLLSRVCPRTPVLTPRAHLFQVHPDIKTRATTEKRDLQRLQLIGDVLVSCLQPGMIGRPEDFVNPFWRGGGRMLSQILWQKSAKSSLPNVPYLSFPTTIYIQD